MHRTPREARCFTVAEDPIAEQADSRVWAPYEEKRTLPGTRADVSWFVCVTEIGLLSGMSSAVSTWMGDRLGIPGAVDFFPFRIFF